MANDNAALAASASSPLIQFDGVSVRYGSKVALESLTLDIPKGAGLAILGLNGAGKTSTIRALLRMIRPATGVVRLFGAPLGLRPDFRRVGFAPEDAEPPEFLSCGEYLAFVAGTLGLPSSERKPAVRNLLDWFELPYGKLIRTLSKGMRRRLVLAQAMMGRRDLLILDEPLNGLDPVLIVRLRDRLREYVAQGGTLLYCSHLLSEVEQCCDSVLFLREGRVAASGSMSAIQNEFGSLEKAFLRHAAPQPLTQGL
jgi:ABC-2 type transport system ATP-binding protein